MKLKLDITPNLVDAIAAEVKAGEKPVAAAMREAGIGLKIAWRGQINGAGSGGPLANDPAVKKWTGSGRHALHVGR